MAALACGNCHQGEFSDGRLAYKPALLSGLEVKWASTYLGPELRINASFNRSESMALSALAALTVCRPMAMVRLLPSTA